MGNWCEKILDIIYNTGTRKCVSCLNDIKYGDICDECIRDLRLNSSLSSFNIDGIPMYYASYYLGSIKNIIYNFKGHKNFYCGDYLGRVLSSYIKKAFRDIDYLIYVPRDKSKIKREGFDQSFYLCKSISKDLNIPYLDLLYCIGKKSDQKKLNISDRKVNIKDKFFINKNIDLDILCNKNILLIDDIATTYNTILEVYNVIKKTSSKTNISILTIAKSLL